MDKKQFIQTCRELGVDEEYHEVLAEAAVEATQPRKVAISRVQLTLPNPAKGSWNPSWRGYFKASLGFPMGNEYLWVNNLPFTLSEQGVDDMACLEVSPHRGSRQNPTYNSEIQGLNIYSGLREYINRYYHELAEEAKKSRSGLVATRSLKDTFLKFNPQEKKWNLVTE